MLGDYDTATGTGDAGNSMKGRLSHLYIVEGVLGQNVVEQLYNRATTPPPAILLLHQENNLMLQYTVDYNSEITQGICVSSNDQNCEGLYTGKIHA